MPSKESLKANPSAEFPATPTDDTFSIIDGEPCAAIRNVDALAPFLMSVVSNTDHWMFVGSNSAITAGRIDPDHALFPYQTADKLLDRGSSGGATTILRVERDGRTATWEPWQPARCRDEVTRNLYKHVWNTSVTFEEINHTLGLAFRWTLSASERHGFVRRCTLTNLGAADAHVSCLDGWHRLLPPGVAQETFARYSYLAAAYMRHELLPAEGLGIYTLNSGITDRAEPSESLRVACAWTLGLDAPAILLSERQVEAFRRGEKISAEREVRGAFGAHLAASDFTLAAGASREWFTIADYGLDHAALVALKNELASPGKLKSALLQGIDENTRGLRARIAAADGLQDTADRAASIHHFANVMFNCMRGGTFEDSYFAPGADFARFIQTRNRGVHAKHSAWLAQLPARIRLDDLAKSAAQLGDAQLTRLANEYLPLSFSRRHGDPSRPWNRFSIRVKDSAGEPAYGYQGNWRDIFQNWESLAQSHPAVLDAMIAVFLNASTADGYNPYRITRDGIEWEVLDPEDPWSHIGYWGDHQIIYLLRLLESLEKFSPGKLSGQLAERLYAYASVPYEIGGFGQICRDPGHSITFNEALHKKLIDRADEIGGDGKLIADAQGDPALVTLAEKLLVPVLVKLSNLVPEGGIWLNTQRPEWNDANNALAGWGLSMVTVYYIRRYLAFLDNILAAATAETLPISTAVAGLLREIATILPRIGATDFDDAKRFEIMKSLGEAGARHRGAVYSQGSGADVAVPVAEIRKFIAAALPVIDASIRANRRDDGTYHSYNLLALSKDRAQVKHLSLMLEGQVAVLSSGALEPDEAAALLGAMRHSDLFRPDQHSYVLYPNREVAPFLARNTLPKDWKTRAPSLAALVVHDANGDAHFHADLTNVRDLNAALDKAGITADRAAALDVWEEVFQHSAFTGRSGGMFAFEGLGSIYWHMIAKLLLAVQETHDHALATGAPEATIAALREAYDDTRHGLGFTKTPEVYGAFPTDPYSHTPAHAGAQQPGMTGQVKEEILTRFGELGVHCTSGGITFEPRLLTLGEFFDAPHDFAFVGLAGGDEIWTLPAGSLGFTYCQVPVCYRLADSSSITIERTDGTAETIPGSTLPAKDTASILARDGAVKRVTVDVPRNFLRASASHA